MPARAGRRRRCRHQSFRKRSPASACRGAGTASLSCCRAGPGTRPATCSRRAPSSWPRAARPKSQWRVRWRSPTSTTTASRAGALRATGRSSMSMRKPVLVLAVVLAFGAGTAAAETPGLGKPITEADITAWNIEVLPDGSGLPPGSGTAKQGAPIYAQKCALCHGENGVNPAPGFLPLVGPSKFDRIDAMKTVPYYKYATTLYDVMRRSMPFPIPKTLTNEELYALSAYILWLNKIIGEDEVMDAKTLPLVKMPNRDNFSIWDPDKIGYEPVRSQAPAMR